MSPIPKLASACNLMINIFRCLLKYSGANANVIVNLVADDINEVENVKRLIRCKLEMEWSVEDYSYQS